VPRAQPDQALASTGRDGRTRRGPAAREMGGGAVRRPLPGLRVVEHPPTDKRPPDRIWAGAANDVSCGRPESSAWGRDGHHLADPVL